MFSDKNLILQIFGSLMKKPHLLSEVDKYFLLPDDFSNTFERNIFSAIYNLYQNGATRITVVDIDNYLDSHPGAHSIFTKENGIEYLNDCEELSQLENFDYYYNKLKKLNCLRDLNKMGYNTSQIYSQEISEDAKKINEKFENLSIPDILEICKKGISTIEHRYQNRYDNNATTAFQGIEELVEQLKISPEIGANLPGHIINTIVRGARKGMFYLKSASSGVGKTRGLVGDACFLSYPIRYDSITESWIQDGSNEKVLYVVTEQTDEEIKTMILSYLADVNEEKILYGKYSFQEGERIKKAIEIMKIYENNFHIAKLSDPNIAQVKALLRKYYFEHNIENVFYDYIFSSPSLLSEFRDLKIQENVVLNMLSTALKDIASELKIFISSSTQLNRGGEDSKTGVKNQNNIRGAISIVDKVDIAYIFARTTPDEIEALSGFIESTGIIPNQVADIYKVRRGRFTNVRVWSLFDYGTCRKRDLFITNGDFSPVKEFTPIQFLNADCGEYNSLLNQLNNNLKKEISHIEEVKTDTKPKIKIQKEVDYF